MSEMTAEEYERFAAGHIDATDPESCDCGHQGLAKAWHMDDCPVVEP